MSTYELATRLDLSPTRVRQFESAELTGFIRLSTLDRAARALNCRLVYFLVPDEPLDEMVHDQAQRKAAQRLSIADPDGLRNEAKDLSELSRLQALEDLTIDLVDHQGLWV